MKKTLFVVVLTCFLCGCIPCKQAVFKGGEQYDHFGYYEYYGLLQIGPSNAGKTAKVLVNGSYAIDPSGRRLSIETEEHDYDKQQKDPRAPYIRDRIYVLDQNGNRLSKLKDGNWKFVFALSTPKGREERTFESKVWTFYYNPILHGPPN